MAAAPFDHNSLNYLSGPGHELNTMDIWIKTSSEGIKSQDTFWIIYVHGGAWRDPEITSMTFKPAVDRLAQAPWACYIAGFCSINYRLSSYPSHPEHPSSPDDASRNIIYPQHPHDVSTALLLMEKYFNIDNRYLLAGHSAGGTIVFQQGSSTISQSTLPQPVCILGIAGIYHIERFLQAHLGIPVYREIILNAFPAVSSWDAASPSIAVESELAIWRDVDALIIARADHDDLVDEAQASLMLKSLQNRVYLQGKVHSLEAHGGHDELWRNGDILAGLIERSLGKTRFHALITP